MLDFLIRIAMNERLNLLMCRRQVLLGLNELLEDIIESDVAHVLLACFHAGVELVLYLSLVLDVLQGRRLQLLHVNLLILGLQ